jgi:hypothetical protein
MRFVAPLVVIVALATCSRRGHDDWRARPLDTVPGRVGSETLGGLDYTVAIPRGLTMQPSSTIGIVEYSTGSGSDRDVRAPVVMIAFDPIPPTSLDAAVANAFPVAGDDVVRRDAIADGFIVTLRGPHHVAARVTRLSGARSVACMAAQADGGDTALDEADRAWLEKICLSLAVK